MIKFTLPVLLLFVAFTVNAQYTETFSTPGRGYLPQLVDNFAGVDWTLTAWDLANRDTSDALQTGPGSGSGTAIPAGVFGGSDLDQEICWTSPLLNATATGNIAFTADISWTGFDGAQTNPLEYINVEYQINNGAWVRHPNVVGANGDPAYTVRFAVAGTYTGAATTNFAAIPVTAGNSVRVRVCFSNNANAELVTLDNVNVTGVSLNCVQPVLSTVVSNIVCNGPNSGAINLTVSGGTPGYTYVWSNGPTTQDISGLAAGAYTVTVTDAASCTQTTSATVISAPIVQSALTSPASCGLANGTIDLSVSGGNPGYTYLWSNGATTQDISGLAAGNYTVTITDSTVPACTSTAMYAVAAAGAGNYVETFGVAGKGYLPNQQDNFFGVNWTLSPWNNEPPAPAGTGRDLDDYFQTTAGGKLEVLDTDMEVCWISPELNTSATPTVGFFMDLSWSGFDNEDYISVQYSADNGAFTSIANQFGGGANTVQFLSTGNTGSGTVVSPSISADKLQIKVCFLMNSQQDVGSLDNVNVPFETTTCFGPDVYAGPDQDLCLTAGSATLAATISDGTGTWSVLSGPSTLSSQFSNVNSPTAVFTPAGGFGVYNLQWSGTNSSGTTVDNVSITFGEPATVTLGPDQTLCASSPVVQLNAVMGGSATNGVFNINPPNGTFSPSDTDPNATYTPTAGEITAGSVTFIWQTNDPGGACEQDRDTMTVFFDPAAIVDAGQPIDVCETAPLALLNATSGGATSSVTWSGGLGTFSNINSLTSTYLPTAGEISFGSVTLTITTNDPTGLCGPASDNVTITIGEAATVTLGPDQTLCANAPVVQLNAVMGGSATNGVFNINPPFGTFSPGDTDPNATYTPTAGEIAAGSVTFIWQTNDPGGACEQDRDTMTVFYNPTPNAVATPASQTVCSGSPITTIVLSGSVPGTTFNWTRNNNVTVTGIPASGSGNIAGTLVNTTNDTVSVRFTITPTANGCAGTPIVAIVLVRPTPNAIATPASQTVCSGNAFSAIAFSGSVAGTVYNWTRDNTATVTGIPASGSGTIVGALTNTTNAPITVTFTITPTANGCPGAPITATILVNPTPNAVATPASQTTCSGGNITTIVLSGNVAGTTYTWTRDNTVTVTGIAANGSGNISGALTNTTNAPITVTFTITPVANFCQGTPITATVLVNPLPNVVATPTAQTICSGNAITTITFTGSVAGTVFNWIRNNTATVTGIAANGSGNISGSLTNTTNAPITVTFTVTPVANGCSPGTPTLVTVLVNPTPLAYTVTGGGGYCIGTDPGAPVGLSGSQTNVNYQLRLNGGNVGAPVAGTGAALNFGFQNGVGTYTVVATHTQGGCTNSMTGAVTVFSFACSVTISDPCGCKNNATTLTNGQFTEGIKVNAPTNQTWTVTAVNGLFAANSPNPPAAPLAIPIGTVLVNIGGNMFTLNGVHVDAIGYTLTVSNGIGTFLTIGNSCTYPNPSITSDLTGPFCLYSDPVPLTGDPGDANIVSQGFTINGAPATVFNPGSGVGQYVIRYTVNGGVPKTFGPNDPGCIQWVEKYFKLLQRPINWPATTSFRSRSTRIASPKSPRT